jgi:hypothetical protein
MGVYLNQARLEEDTLQALQQHLAMRIPYGHYWYDLVCGAVGLWAGPAAMFISSGLKLDGELAPNASRTGQT